MELAQRGAGQVSPNPMVGAVIVKKGRVLAEGFHQKYGKAHAEIEALKKLNFKAQGATLYCNLEPCFHEGKTPACVRVILQSGIKKVVVAHLDPNPLVCGRSIKFLRKHGVLVSVGPLKKEAQFLNRSFLTWIQKKRPYVLLKVAMSLDGRITWPGKKSGRFTSKESLRRVHQLRSKVDAILVGINTVLADDPRLNVRGIKGARQPMRIILDTQGHMPNTCRMLRARGGPILIVGTNHAPHPAEPLILDTSQTGRVSLPKLLKELAGRGVGSLMVEGGGEVFSSFIEEGLVDELVCFIAPQIFGQDSKTFISSHILKSKAFRLFSVKKYGDDLELTCLRS